MGRVGLCVYVIDAHTQSKSASHMSNFWEDADYVTVNIVLLLFTYCLKKLFIHYYIQKNKNKKILEVVCRLYITSLLIPHPQLCRVLAHLCPNAAVPNVQNSIHYSSISVLIDSDIKWINSTISQKSHSSPASLQKFQDSELLKTNNNKKKTPFTFLEVSIFVKARWVHLTCQLDLTRAFVPQPRALEQNTFREQRQRRTGKWMAATEEDNALMNLHEQCCTHKDDEDISRRRHLEWWEACLCKLSATRPKKSKVILALSSSIFFIYFYSYLKGKNEGKQSLKLLLNLDVRTSAEFFKPKPDSYFPDCWSSSHI